MVATPAKGSRATDVAARATQGMPEFEDLLREHQAMVFSIACHFLQDSSSAEEVAQEVFLELYRHLGQLQTPAHAKNWLRKATVSRCIDCSRRRKLRPRLGLDEIPEPAAATAESDPLLRDRLQRLIAALPEKWRAIVILRFQEDLEPAEISEVLRIPLGTVKSQLHRAMMMMREKLTRAKGERN